MTAIPGIPGCAEPSFRTGDRGWMSLDELVREVVVWLHADGRELSPYVVKATVQITRSLVGTDDSWEAEDLFPQLVTAVRRAGVILQPDQVEQIVRVYASLVAMLDIQDVSELGV